MKEQVELKGKETPKVADFVDEFAEALKANLALKEKEWGTTWLHRTREGQEERSWANLVDWYDQFRHAGIPIPQLDIAGDALICWIREQHPELFPGGGTKK